MMEMEQGVSVLGRAEIDTRAPFKSVKEAVSLFGEKVLAGELYTNQLKKIWAGNKENGHGLSKLGTVTAELEETKESLMKAREESLLMVHCLSSLKEELEQTKRELQQLKAKDSDEKRPIDESEIEDLKFIETPIKVDVEKQLSDEGAGYQRKRFVKFASSPVVQVISSSPERSGHEVQLERHPSLKKKKKKPLIPLIGGIFSRKKATQGVSLNA